MVFEPGGNSMMQVLGRSGELMVPLVGGAYTADQRKCVDYSMYSNPLLTLTSRSNVNALLL